MQKNSIAKLIVIILFILSCIFFVSYEKMYDVIDVQSPTMLVLSNNNLFKLEGLETFDASFSEKNKILANRLGISESEAFVLGNLAKQWADNLMKGRTVYKTTDSDLIFYRYSYRTKFLYSGFCLVDSEPYNIESWNKRLYEIRKGNFVVLDLETENYYKPQDLKSRELNNFVVIRKTHLSKNKKEETPIFENSFIEQGDIKIFFTDLTTKLKPDRECSSIICKEILKNINSAQYSIDMAIYGYSSTPLLEEALISAINRGVKVRLVYDLDSSGNNIYPDTNRILKIIPDAKSDLKSSESKNIMHNKFYIFDDKVLITGSANLSHTDMSGFNSNSIVLIKSPHVANVYKKEFEQMFSGKFHNDKKPFVNKKIKLSDTDLEIYFSPQDKALANTVLPLIRNAKKYIYIPTFVLTEKRVTQELINAKNRGVDVKILIDALNASIKHSKHNELRQGSILVKTENYAGKMHSKSMIVDDKYVIIGSMNFSNSGENRNDENLILIKNPQIAKQYKEFFIYQWTKVDDKWLKFNARAEGKDSLGSCFDGIDNNYDGLIDKADLACK